MIRLQPNTSPTQPHVAGNLVRTLGLWQGPGTAECAKYWQLFGVAGVANQMGESSTIFRR